jgi:hypothetical protein
MECDSMPDDRAEALLTMRPCDCNASTETPSTPAICRTVAYLREEQDRAIRSIGERKIRDMDEAVAVARLALVLTTPPPTNDPVGMLHWRLARFVVRLAAAGEAVR